MLLSFEMYAIGTSKGHKGHALSLSATAPSFSSSFQKEIGQIADWHPLLRVGSTLWEIMDPPL